MEQIDSGNPEETDSVAVSIQPAIRIRARQSVSEEPTKKSVFNHSMLDLTDPGEPESSETQATARMEDTNRPPSDTPNANWQSSRGTQMDEFEAHTEDAEGNSSPLWLKTENKFYIMLD
jgi:hypothetical protein